jgi:hypothetical protein
MRTLAILLAALAFGLVAPALAAPPDHAGGPGGNPAGPGPTAPPSPEPPPTPSSPATSPPPTSPGQAKKDGAPEGQGKAKPGKAVNEPPGQAKKSQNANRPAAPTDQNEAQQAVENEQALPLAQIIKIAERRTPGRVINARMLTVSGVLLYQVTLLDDDGRSWRNYYLAKSGNPVVLR